ncbi:MAG: SWIM zinc finger family protein, partial [Actinobacteria bacterium]|nr:SWIM zinc finger family protein [Actinomycetota bacterium]
MAIRVKSATWVNGVTDYAVARVVGDISLTRGRQYARDGAVLTLVEGAQGDLLLATVQGSGAQAYQTIVERIDGSDGSAPDWAGRCSCPMRVDCKHTAAVLLTARDAFSLTEAPLPPPWEQVLAPLATTAAQTGDLPRVALEVSLSTRPGRSSE